jgi:hypothetical protein
MNFVNTIESNIFELIKATYFRSEQLAAFPAMIRQRLLVHNKSVDSVDDLTHEIIEAVKSESFLSQFVPAFKETFSEEEVQELLKIYQSDVMRKYFLSTETIFLPIYKAYNHLIDKAILALS